MPDTTTQKPTLRIQLHAEAASQIDSGKYSTKSAAFEAAGSVLGKTAGNVSTAYNTTNTRLHAEVADLIASGSSQQEAIVTTAEKHHTSVEAVSHAYGAKAGKQATANRNGKTAVKTTSHKVVASVEGMAHSVTEKLARSSGKGKAPVLGGQSRKRAARNESAAALAAQGAELYQRAADAARRRVQEAEYKLEQVRADHAERLAQEERDLEKRKASLNRAFERQEKKAAANLSKVKDDSAAEIAKYEALAKAIS